MHRQEIIDALEELVEQMKEKGVQDAGEYAYEHAIYSIEDAIEHLKENED
jgi:hypothetical protein